jgi:hypothetical protein
MDANLYIEPQARPATDFIVGPEQRGDRTLLFAEGERPRLPVRGWVQFLLDLGHAWASSNAGKRRIGLVSMPCDSPAAGLVALGALRRFLEVPAANDTSRHVERMEEARKNYLSKCKRYCMNKRCEPEVIRCGLRRRILIRTHEYPTQKFHFMDRSDALGFWVEEENDGDKKRVRAADGRRGGPLRTPIFKSKLSEWFLDGEPPLQGGGGSVLPDAHLYEALADASPVIPRNLAASHSALCLAGRVMGEHATRTMLEQARFFTRGRGASVAQLLSIHSWTPETISRTCFFNKRIDQFDRWAGPPLVAVADGDATFVEIVNRDEFRGAHLIGVYDRTRDHDTLERLREQWSTLRQWYDEDHELDSLEPPRGIGLAVIKAR